MGVEHIIISPSSEMPLPYPRIPVRFLWKISLHFTHIVWIFRFIRVLYQTRIFLKDLLLEVRNASPLPKTGIGLGPGNLSPSSFILEFGAQNLCHKYNKTISRIMNRTMFTLNGNCRIVLNRYLKILIVLKYQLNRN